MKKNKLLTFLAFTLFVGLAVSACSDKVNDSSSSSKSGSSTSITSSSTIIDSSSTTTNNSSSSTTTDSTTAQSSTPSVDSSTNSSSTSPVTQPIVVSIAGEQNVNVDSTITLTATVQNSTQGVTWASDHNNIATVTAGESNTATVRGISEGQAAITATSIEDTEKKATITITVVDTRVKISVQVADYATAETAETSVEEGSGARSLKVGVTNLPTGKTENDVTITWPESNAMHTIEAHNVLGSNKFVTGYVPMGAGRDHLEIKVKIGDDEYVQVYNFPITRKDADYTVISTPKQFIDLVENANPTGKYILGANLDLTGYVKNYATASTTFVGVLDGDGHTIKGITQKPTNGVDGGFFLVFNGILRNIRLEGEVFAEKGFTGLFAKEILARSVVQDVMVISKDVTEPADPADWTWQRNGTIAAFNRGLVMDSILLENPDGTRNNRTISTIPYGANKAHKASAEGAGLMYNVYTNGGNDGAGNDTSMVFDPGNEYYSTIDYKEFHNEWKYTEKLAADYALDTTIWTLADHQLPKLAHDADQFVTIQPSVEITGQETSVKVGNSITLTAVPTFVDSSKTITYAFAASEAGKVNITNDGAVATVEGAAEGSVNITCTMTYEDKQYTSAPFAVTVLSADAPDHTGLEIKDLAGLKAFFNGNASNNDVDAYLSADIDCTGWDDIPDIAMADTYRAKFDGAGHRLYNLTIKSTLFNSIGENGSVFDLTLEGTYTGTGGYAYLCYGNNGLIHDVDLKIAIDVALNDVPNAPFAQNGNGTIRDCTADVTFVEGKLCRNYFAVEAAGGATIENVTVTYHNAVTSAEGAANPDKSTINAAPYEGKVELINGDAAA